MTNSARQIGAALLRQERARKQAEQAANAPKVGDLASFGYGADSYPYTVVAVSPSGHQVTLQSRKAYACKGNNPFEGRQHYMTVEDPNGALEVFTRRKDGRYRPRGSSYRGCPSVGFGHATYYQDPHF
jgi:hypothetical protein